ncbi:MAG: TIGR04211 family SH3 domain-containing protein [Candidatus Magnetomorum sp.]|nr:TIGR04211 family SH3 domain-containing protein [Candidatus Magnetomorum sp.]
MKMKMFLFFVVTCLLLVTTAFSETRYVTERMRITLRTGPDVSYKVVGLVNSGEPVEIIESLEEWTRVETSESKVGWVMTRFLSTDIPKKDLLERLEKEHEKLKEKSTSLASENENLIKENKDINRELSKKVLELKALKEKYDTLDKGCQKYTALKKTHDQISQQMDQRQAELVQLKEEKAILESNQLFWGFGLALGVLAVGFIIGKSSQRKRSGRLT